MPTSLEIQLKTIPDSPGVYQYYDKEEKILYVGKAKNLKKRVASYFTKNHENAKTRILVKKIVSIKHIVVDTETDALLLENNLIKKYQPRYNIMLKDDKTYPWICIKKERFPRIFMTRRVIKDGSEYYGPYTNIRTVKVLLDLIRELYPLRTCKYDLSKEKIAVKKYKVCLEYHLGNCNGPCEDFQIEQEYLETIKAIRNIVKGNFKESLKKFQNIMQLFSEKMEFEEAQKIKEKLDLLSNYQSKSTIVNPSINNVDVFSIISDENYGYVNFFKIANGAIIQSHTTEIKKKLDESDKKILEPQIIDCLLIVKTDLIAIGQAKGKFGGGKRRAWRQTQRKTKEGNVPTFSTMAVVGDENGHIGIGSGKSQETLPARDKGIRKAKLNVMKIGRSCASFDCACAELHTVPFKVTGKSGSVKVTLIPAPQGTGLAVANELKKILKLAGIKDVYSRTDGQQRTTFNLAKACINALKKTNVEGAQ